MARSFYFPHKATVPRQPQLAPEGLGTHLLWTRTGEWSHNDSLAQLSMPKEWARVEALRKARRDRILKGRVEGGTTQAVPSGIEAGRVVAEEAGGVNDTPEDSREAGDPNQRPGEQHTSQSHPIDRVEREGGDDDEGGDRYRGVDSLAAGGAEEANAENFASGANGAAASHQRGDGVAADGTGRGGSTDEDSSGVAAPHA